MTIGQLESKLNSLNTEVETIQDQLAQLKQERQTVKIRLTEARKAAKAGKLPAEPAVEGITDKLKQVLTETVADPIAEMLGIADEPATVRVARQALPRKTVPTRRKR